MEGVKEFIYGDDDDYEDDDDDDDDDGYDDDDHPGPNVHISMYIMHPVSAAR